MRILLLVIFVVQSAAFSAEGGICIPTYSFVAGNEKSTREFIDGIDKKGTFNGGISIEIVGAEQDLGEATWYLDSLHYNKDAKGVIATSASAAYAGSPIVIAHLPLTTYAFEIGNDRGVLYRAEIPVQGPNVKERFMPQPANLWVIGGSGRLPS